MKFHFCEKLYSDGFSEKKLKAVKSKIKHGKIMAGIFLITLPLTDDGVLEIYRYPEFLLPIYKKLDDDVTVIGIAKSKEDAFSLVERIVKDVGVNAISGGRHSLIDYFEGGTDS
ncbi:MAG: hypothetical protein IJ661_06760 [Lachnospiraceae bacterium]|nr:hypothetical protein [Lachnospiraceae bacterium]